MPLNEIIDLKRVTNLGGDPITLEEAKTQLRVDFADDDTEITSLISKAIRHVESYCNISIAYQRISLISRMEREWKLPYGPVIGIESVSDNTLFTGSGPVSYESSDSDWKFDGDTFDPNGCYRMKIVYTAGNFCPPDLKDVILQVITFLYENRGEDIKTADLNDILKNADAHKVLIWI